MESFRKPPFSLRLATVILLSGMAASCSHLRPGGDRLEDRQGRVITAREIERSGARTAWDALRWAGANLSLTEDDSGQPVTMRKRGNASMVLSNAPVVVLDGIPVADLRSLVEVPARIIGEIRILNGVDGTARYGTGSGNGVIVVTTLSDISRSNP